MGVYELQSIKMRDGLPIFPALLLKNDRKYLLTSSKYEHTFIIDKTQLKLSLGLDWAAVGFKVKASLRLLLVSWSA